MTEEWRYPYEGHKVGGATRNFAQVAALSAAQAEPYDPYGVCAQALREIAEEFPLLRDHFIEAAEHLENSPRREQYK